MRKFLVFILVIPFSMLAQTGKIVFFGHTYPILKTKEKGELFVKELMEQSPEVAFSLGDVSKTELPWMRALSDSLNGKIYGVHGNHDYSSEVPWVRGSFLARTSNANYLLLNSGLSLESLKRKVSQLLKDELGEKPLVVLCHHRIWDDNLMSKKELSHDKSYKWKDFLKIFPTKPRYIIAGNSPGQYFGNQFSNGQVNKNIVFWSDVIDGVTCYSVGAGGTRGMSRDVLTYVVGQWVDGELLICPRRLNFSKSLKRENQKVKASSVKEKPLAIVKWKLWLILSALPFILLFIRRLISKKG